MVKIKSTFFPEPSIQCIGAHGSEVVESFQHPLSLRGGLEENLLQYNKWTRKTEPTPKQLKVAYEKPTSSCCWRLSLLIQQIVTGLVCVLLAPRGTPTSYQRVGNPRQGKLPPSDWTLDTETKDLSLLFRGSRSNHFWLLSLLFPFLVFEFWQSDPGHASYWLVCFRVCMSGRAHSTF